MNKIGFAITRASQGTGSVLTCNEGAWTSHITDIREYIKLFGATLDESRAIPFLTFAEEGCFLGVIRHIIGSIDDFFGGWIYIPRNIAISGEELEQTLEFVKSVLTEESVHLKAAEINTRFATTYPERYSSPYIPSGGERYGVRNPGGMMGTMAEILEHRYQESYKGFKAIFLTDPVYVANEYKSRFGNFTNRKLEKSFIVIPPTDVSSFGDGTKLLVYNGEKYVHFSSPVRTKEGTPLRMSLKRPPFDSYRFTYNATKDNDVIDLQPLKFEWSIRVSRSQFNVFGEDHRPIVDAIIRIGDEVINGDLLIKESAAKNAEILVSAVGYKETKVVLDLFHLEEKIEINLVRNSTNYTHEILLNTGTTGIVTVEAPGLNPSVCPLAGYKTNEKGVLTFDRLFSYKQRALGFGAALGLGAIIWLSALAIGAITGDDEKDTDKEKEETEVVEKKDTIVENVEGEDQEDEDGTDVEEMTEEEEVEATPAISEEAMTVLKKDVWKKSELEAQEDLAGLFDALNNYRVGELTGEGKWAEAIKEAQPALAEFLANDFPEAQYRNPSFLPKKEGVSQTITISTFPKYVKAAADKKRNPQASTKKTTTKTTTKTTAKTPAKSTTKTAAKTTAKPAAKTPAKATTTTKTSTTSSASSSTSTKTTTSSKPATSTKPATKKVTTKPAADTPKPAASEAKSAEAAK